MTRYPRFGRNRSGTFPPPPNSLPNKGLIPIRSLVLDTQHRSPCDDRLRRVMPSAVHRGRGLARSPRRTCRCVTKHTRLYEARVDHKQDQRCEAQTLREHTPSSSGGSCSCYTSCKAGHGEMTGVKNVTGLWVPPMQDEVLVYNLACDDEVFILGKNIYKQAPFSRNEAPGFHRLAIP